MDQNFNTPVINPLISKRKSIRAFSNQQITNETMQLLFEAARWGASSMNEQPWRFIVAKKENTTAFNKMVDCLLPGNSSWAKYGAALILVCAKQFFTQNNLFNKHAMHDTGFAVANLSLQATDMNIYLHQMGGFDNEKARIHFNVPQGFEIISIIVIGYKGDENNLSESLKVRETAVRSRKALTETVYEGTFNMAFA